MALPFLIPLVSTAASAAPGIIKALKGPETAPVQQRTISFDQPDLPLPGMRSGNAALIEGFTKIANDPNQFLSLKPAVDIEKPRAPETGLLSKTSKKAAMDTLLKSDAIQAKTVNLPTPDKAPPTAASQYSIPTIQAPLQSVATPDPMSGLSTTATSAAPAAATAAASGGLGNILPLLAGGTGAIANLLRGQPDAGPAPAQRQMVNFGGGPDLMELLRAMQSGGF